MKGSNASESIVYEEVGGSEDPSRETGDAAEGNASTQVDDEVEEARIASHSGESATPSPLQGSKAFMDADIRRRGGLHLPHSQSGQ